MIQRIVKILSVTLLVLFISCSTDPETPPKFRVSNERTENVSLQVKTSGGNTININNVTSGQVTEYSEVAQGTVQVTLTVQGIQTEFTGSFEAQNNKLVTVVAANTTPPSIRIDIQ